jgi:hypothetical protein
LYGWSMVRISFKGFLSATTMVILPKLVIT